MNKLSVFLVAPSGKINKKDLILAIRNVSKLGFNIKYRKDIRNSFDYFAGTLKRRIEELNEAFTSDKEFIFTVRGGYASMELLDKLNWKEILKTKKLFMGHSDITSILIALKQKKYGGIIIHGPNVGTNNFISNQNYINFFKKICYNKQYKVDFKKIKKCKYKNISNFSGEIVGGNLRIISHMINTEFDIEIKKNSILFLEDVNERPAAIYTMLVQLEKIGKLKNIKAFLLSKMIKCGDYLPLIELFLIRINVPVIYEIPLGHQKNMIPIRIGSNVNFDCKNKILTFFPV